MKDLIEKELQKFVTSILVFALVSNWVAILISQYRFRLHKIRNHEDNALSFKMPFWPYSSYFAMAFMVLIVVMLAILPPTRIAIIVGPF